MKSDQINTGIKSYLKETLWVAGLQRQVKFAEKTFKELMDWCSLLKCDYCFHLVDNIQQQEMVSLCCDMNYFVSTYVEELDRYNKQFDQHVHKNLLITNE